MLYVHAFFSVNFFPVTVCDLLVNGPSDDFHIVAVRDYRDAERQKAIKMHIYI